MAHDYARKPTGKPRSGAKPRNKSPQKPTTQGSTAKAFLAGMLTGAVCMYFIPVLLDDSDNQASIAEQREEAMSESKNQGLKFDFYTLLKETEIIVPEGEERQSAPKPEENYSYLLQVGSFRNAKDADSLRAQLIILNLNANVETVGQNGDKWHRVLVGPFPNTSKMASARAKLAENRIDSLLLKRKP